MVYVTRLFLRELIVDPMLSLTLESIKLIIKLNHKKFSNQLSLHVYQD